MAETTGLRMKDCISLCRLGWKYFSSLREEDDETVYSYKDRCTRWFERQSKKRGCVCAFNQHYHSKSCNDMIQYSSKGV